MVFMQSAQVCWVQLFYSKSKPPVTSNNINQIQLKLSFTSSTSFLLTYLNLHDDNVAKVTFSYRNSIDGNLVKCISKE